MVGATRFRRTTGVRPMVPRMLSWIMANPACDGGRADTTPVDGSAHGHGWHAGKRPMERSPRGSRSRRAIGLPCPGCVTRGQGSAEHTYELQSLMRLSYAVFCLKKKNNAPS